MSEEKGFLEKLTSEPADLWENHKMFFIFFGVIILIIKFRSILIDLIVSDSKKKFDEANKQSDVLQNEENNANNKANELISNADKKLKNSPSVDENWNKES